MSSLFRIVTEGRLRADINADDFVVNFSKIFKVSDIQAKKVLSAGGRITLKNNLDAETAEKYQRVLQEQIGLIVNIEEIPNQGTESYDLTNNGYTPEPDAQPATSPSIAEPSVQCPKCGSNRVSGDDCLACGIIISRYRARQAEKEQSQAGQSDWNPYESVYAQDVDEEGFSARRVDAGSAWHWIVGGWKHFTGNPLAWILTLIIWYLITLVAGLVPIVGPVGINLLSPVFIAGMMLGAREQASGGNFTIGHLFQGFSTEFSKLIQAGLLYLAAIVLVFFVGLIIFGIFGLGVMFQHAESVAYASTPSMIGIFLLILLVVVAMALLAMAFYYVPLLIVFDSVGPIDAFKLSFAACWKNAIPFLVYGLILIGLGIVATLPFGLGFFVLAPVMVASVFVSYRSIFYGETN